MKFLRAYLEAEAAIRERHEEHQGDIENLWSQCRGTPEASMDEELIAHYDRGILLNRLEAAEAQLAKVRGLPEKWRSILGVDLDATFWDGVDGCANELQAILDTPQEDE